MGGLNLLLCSSEESLSLESRGGRINDECLIKAIGLQWQHRWLQLSETGLIAGIYHREGNG